VGWQKRSPLPARLWEFFQFVSWAEYYSVKLDLKWHHILLNAVFPAISPWTWKQCEQLLPHLLTCAAAVPEGAVDPDLAEILRKAADYLRGRARFAQAEPLYQRALSLEERMGGCTTSV
jgi:hypothetical protein